jgi:hypothetical protein
LLERRLPSPAGASKGCPRDKSFPYPEVVAFPRVEVLRKPERKRHGFAAAMLHHLLCLVTKENI